MTPLISFRRQHITLSLLDLRPLSIVLQTKMSPSWITTTAVLVLLDNCYILTSFCVAIFNQILAWRYIQAIYAAKKKKKLNAIDHSSGFILITSICQLNLMTTQDEIQSYSSLDVQSLLFSKTKTPKLLFFGNCLSSTLTLSCITQILLGCKSKLDADIPTYSIFPETYDISCKDMSSSGGGVFSICRSSQQPSHCRGKTF